MRISVQVTTADVTLVDPNVFSSFDVSVNPSDASNAEVVAALGPIASSAGDDHVWISVDAIQQLAGNSVSSEWLSNFENMMAHAASMEWTNDDQSMLKGHIIRP